MPLPSALRRAHAGSPKADISLLGWVWRAYVRNALVPLLVVELLLVAVYLTSHGWALGGDGAARTAGGRAEVSRRVGRLLVAVDRTSHGWSRRRNVAALTEVARD